MNLISNQFSARFDPTNQEFTLIGKLRPRVQADLHETVKLISEGLKGCDGVAYLNVRRLTHINQTAFHALGDVLTSTCRARPDLSITVVTSSVIAWSAKVFGMLAANAPNLTVDVYDSAFYPGQTFVEDESFIPILRTQTKMTWRHERQMLPRHGLKTGAKIADICCGIGDFAALLQKEFCPARIVALDHSMRSLAYARRVATDFGLTTIEYTYGDASEMLLSDNEFDFVTCRHSLQIFDKPEVLLRELYRICRPGGRVYITNEKNSHCLGEPHSESIGWTYKEVAKLFSHFDMDVEMGPKSRRLLTDAGFDEIQVESFMVTNLDGDAQDFADVIEAWENVYAGEMAVRRGDTPEFIRKFRQGFEDHRMAALHPKGYAGWPIWAASGRKPY